jgi:hypothetical protein
MKTFDQYSLTLLEQGKRFLEKAKEDKIDDGKVAYLVASLFISFCSLEAFINSIVSEFASWDKLSIHEKALLLEKNVKFCDGKYVISDQLQMTRLTDKIELLLRKFNCPKNYKQSKWWALLGQGINLKNSISHPKEVKQLNDEQIESALESIIDCLDYIFKAIYKKGFPYKNKGLNSQFSF